MQSFEDSKVWTLNNLAEAAHKISVEHGFYATTTAEEDHALKQLCLIHSEVSEAVDELRDGIPNNHPECVRKGNKPQGLNSELADIIIRTVDLAAFLEIDLDKAVKLKMAYNATRPFKHGHKNF